MMGTHPDVIVFAPRIVSREQRLFEIDPPNWRGTPWNSKPMTIFWGSSWSNRQNLWEKQGEIPNLMASYQISWLLLVLVLLGGAIWWAFWWRCVTFQVAHIWIWRQVLWNLSYVLWRPWAKQKKTCTGAERYLSREGGNGKTLDGVEKKWNSQGIAKRRVE